MIRRTKDAVVNVATSTAEDPNSASVPVNSVGKIRSIDHNKGRGDIEHDHVGDDGKRRDQGLGNFELSLECTLDLTDTGQQILYDAVLYGQDYLVTDYLYDGTNGWRNICAVTTGEDGIEGGGLEKVTFEFTSSKGYLWIPV